MNNNLEDLKNWILKNENKKKYPNFLKALKEFENIVGFEQTKDHFYKKLKSIIFLNLNVITTKKSIIQTRSMINKKRKRKQKNKNSSRKISKRNNNRADLKNIFKKILLEKLYEEDDEEDEEEYVEDDAEEDAEEDDEDDEDEEDEDEEDEEEDVEDDSKTNNYGFLDLHLVIIGPSGVGKTYISKKIFDLYASLRLIDSKKFVCVTRGDLVGSYQGWSSKKTKNLIQKYKNGVIFIDEAYALVNNTRDTFGNEAFIEIIEAMTNKSKNVTFFFAGYKKSMMDTLFKANEGFERRVPTILELEKPNSAELFQIFLQNLNFNKKKIKIKIQQKHELSVMQIFTRNYGVFTKFGGDVLVFVEYIKNEIINRMWHEEIDNKFILNLIPEDVSNAIISFKKHKLKRKQEVSNYMYI
jgi:hypothetical protein